MLFVESDDKEESFAVSQRHANDAGEISHGNQIFALFDAEISKLTDKSRAGC